MEAHPLVLCVAGPVIGFNHKIVVLKNSADCADAHHVGVLRGEELELHADLQFPPVETLFLLQSDMCGVMNFERESLEEYSVSLTEEKTEGTWNI